GRSVGVRLDALLADHHRFHEATHAEVRLGEGLVRFGGRFRREGMLQLRELGRAQRLRGRGRHLKGQREGIFYVTRSPLSQMQKAWAGGWLDSRISPGYRRGAVPSGV